MIQIDMEMPKSCKECSLPHIIANGNYCYSSCSTGRPDWCPLVDLGKHGDLIDRDKVMPKLNFINEAEHQIYGRASWGFTAKCIDTINDALPVIEAEDEE